MSPNKRDRDYARRRYQEWQRRQELARARKRRQRVIAGGVVGALVVALGIGGAFALNRGTPSKPPASSRAYTLADPSVAEGRTWTGTVTTNVGNIGVSLDGAAAPQAVANFVSLAQQGFFDATSAAPGVPCHRLVTSGIFVLQCGDPTGTGQGGPGYTWGPIENAPSDNVYKKGVIAMARAGDDGASMGSQFFFVYQDSPIPADAAGGYTVFGTITSGLDVVQAVADAGVQAGKTDGPPVTDVTIEGVEVQ